MLLGFLIREPHTSEPVKSYTLIQSFWLGHGLHFSLSSRVLAHVFQTAIKIHTYFRVENLEGIHFGTLYALLSLARTLRFPGLKLPDVFNSSALDGSAL